MFSLVRTSPLSTKQALMASVVPFPTANNQQTASAPVTSLTDSTTPRRPRRFTGAAVALRPSSPRISTVTIQGMRAASETRSPLLRQAYSTALHMSPREATFTPPSPTFAIPPSSARMPIKSCLKSPAAGPKSPVANIHSPRFASVGLMSIRSGEGPLWSGESSLYVEEVPSSPHFASSAITPIKSGEGPLWTGRSDLEDKMRKMDLRQEHVSDGAVDAVEWKQCRTRIPTPFQSPRTEWLGSE